MRNSRHEYVHIRPMPVFVLLSGSVLFCCLSLSRFCLSSLPSATLTLKFKLGCRQFCIRDTRLTSCYRQSRHCRRLRSRTSSIPVRVPNNRKKIINQSKTVNIFPPPSINYRFPNFMMKSFQEIAETTKAFPSPDFRSNAMMMAASVNEGIINIILLWSN